MPDVWFVRFESAHADRDGHHVGIFGLVNVLGRHGMLTPTEEQFRREANEWYDAAYPDPGRADPSIYDRSVHDRTEAWFKATATHLLERVPPYLDVLDAHRIAWTRRDTDVPGDIIYEDSVQVVTVPRPLLL